MKQGKILIVDDNESILKSLKILLRPEFEQIDLIKNPELLLSQFETHQHDIILLDMNFKTGINTGNEGLYWLKKILKSDKEAIVILITAYGDIELAVKAIKLGAADFVQKPWDGEKLIATLKSAYRLRQSRKEIQHLKKKQTILHTDLNRQHDPIIGKSKAMQEIFKLISKVAKTDANVLITGENGTGKELIAREIHLKSKRKTESFVTVDMGAINENLFESDLFGHKKGSFTDAKEDRIGRIEAAHRGSLFMDEIGNLPLSLQAKLLRVLQDRKVQAIGSNEEIEVDIRIITATNKSLDEMVTSNLFREDLMFRLNTIEIELPPLRNRDNDIALLSEYFLNNFGRKYEKTHLKLTSDALQKLSQYHWPGNIRELKHTIEKAVILSEKDHLDGDDFFFKSYFEPAEESISIKLYEVEKETIRKALLIHKGNMSKIAREMEVSRTTLYKKMKKYGL